MNLSNGETISANYLDDLVVAIYRRLDSMQPPPQPGKDPRRFFFDTPFFNSQMSLLTDTELQYQGTTFKRSEVNYLGQGMWSAAAGESVGQALALVEEYKQEYWGEPATPGVIFWTTFGYDAYNRLSLSP